MQRRARSLGLFLVAALGCGAPAPVTPVAPAATTSADAAASESAPRGAADGSASPVSPSQGASEEDATNARLAAIQKAMNELDELSQACWAAAATQRFDIEGEITMQIDIARTLSQAQVVRDTINNGGLRSCLMEGLRHYRWAPPLYGQAIQLPFKFRAPDGQNTIDRALVPWSGQRVVNARVSVAVLLDENNSGNDAASMFELAIAAGGNTELRLADRAELWYFLAAGEVRFAGRAHPVAAGDMMYVPKGAARDVAAPAGDLHAVIVMVPGGREGAARAGALPTRLVPEGAKPAALPIVLPATGAKTFGPATIFADAAVIRDKTLAASILTLPANGQVAEHVHANESELLYLLAGSGTMTVNGVALPVVPTSVVQIPRNTRHAFTATSEVRAVQIYTPGGPEQRFKTRP